MIPPPLGTCAVGDPWSTRNSSGRSEDCEGGRHHTSVDLRRRLCQHNEGISRATRNRGPYELVYFEAYRHSVEAMAREQSLKKHPNVMKQLKARLARSLAMASARFQEVGG